MKPGFLRAIPRYSIILIKNHIIFRKKNVAKMTQGEII